jgi:hypothetical protein
MGWNKFKFEILEIIDDLPTLRKRENYYLKTYYPLLNLKKTSQITIKRKPKRIDHKKTEEDKP